MNLLNNAAMFSSPTEPITIAAEHDSLQVTVHVRDRGRGIPKEKLPLLFKKFSRLHDDAGQRLSGTGLGLAICKGIVEAHGGRIWAESAGECEGSTFSFTLPVAVGVSVKAASDEARRAAHLGRVRRPTEKTRVLAVDDEPQILRYLRRSLDEAGYQPIVTADPCEVAKLVELEEPDLVLLDLMLPGTSGFELLERIREFSGVPVIFLTASDQRRRRRPRPEGGGRRLHHQALLALGAAGPHRRGAAATGAPRRDGGAPALRAGRPGDQLR